MSTLSKIRNLFPFLQFKLSKESKLEKWKLFESVSIFIFRNSSSNDSFFFYKYSLFEFYLQFSYWPRESTAVFVNVKLNQYHFIIIFQFKNF